MIPYGKQNINQSDINAVIEVLKSDFLTQGPAVPIFEAAVAEYCNAKYSTAVNSATSALHLACRSLDLKPGETLWTSPISFVASSNCALYCGANVDFVDINPNTYNVSIESLEEKLRAAQKSNNLPKIVIPVHFAGQSCEMQAIYDLSKQYGFKIIEDASHAIGGDYKTTKIGCCVYSDITVFSFHPVKIITSGEGGMALTNDEAIYKRLNLLRTHGITREPTSLISQSNGPWYYEQIDLGYNYRLSDIHAALGYSQLKRLDMFVKRRRELAKNYDSLITNKKIIKPAIHPDTASSAWHLYTIRLKDSDIKGLRKNVAMSMLSSGIGVNIHYIPIHLQPYYKALGFKEGDFPNAEKYYKECLTLPIYFDLTFENQEFIIDKLHQCLR